MRPARTSPAADAEVIVIGAGAAGLAAASDLARHGCRILVLEARERIGGRVLSLQPRGWPAPVELGAEFIHGGDRSMGKLLRRAGLVAEPVNVPMWWHEGGQLEPVPDFWPRIARVARRIPWRDRGWTFARFLREYGSKISARDRRMMQQYIGGFNAAPLDQISAHALRADRAGAKLDDFKLREPYARVLNALRDDCPRGLVRIRLRSVVRAIEWRRGSVVVHLQDRRRSFRARAAVITLPVGVLRAGAVRFTPAIAARQKLVARLGWGYAVRVMVRFKPRFWSAPVLPAALRGTHGRNFGFINAAGQPVPTWWALSAPVPVLTGWAGGDDARRLERAGPRAVRTRALRSLAAILGTTVKQLRPWVVDFRWHDWSRDPFARGAYSFPKAGLEDGAERLAEPIADTLFFAGEATAAEAGTVHGALQSGRRVAQEVRKVLRSSRT